MLSLKNAYLYTILSVSEKRKFSILIIERFHRRKNSSFTLITRLYLHYCMTQRTLLIIQWQNTVLP